MAANLTEKEEPELGLRETSPPGRETREDWKGGQRPPPTGNDATDSDKTKARSRSRSPLNRGGRRNLSPRRSRGFSRDSNTISDEPHLQRARLFVGNIEPNRTHRRDLVKLFSRHGEVLGVSVHKGYAFVQMDREKSANKAINYEDNRMFMGSRIHVEFSQAANKAGAKFIRIPVDDSPPPRDVRTQSIALLEIEREREERLARILQMERELAYLHTRDDYGSRRPPDHPRDPPRYDRHDDYRRGGSPPMSSSRDMGYPSRKDSMYDNARPPDDRGRSYYNRSGSPDPLSRGPSGGGGPYRDVSYPVQGGGGGPNRYDRRDGPPQYGGYSRPSQMSAPSVGYGSSASGKPPGPGGAPPPGWPSSDYDKSSANQPPFANSGPWS